MCLQVINVSGVLQRIRVTPPKSSSFHMSQAAFPGCQGDIAPGMHALLRVRFTPASLANINDAIIVATPAGKVTVPLRAARIAPVLTLPRTVNLGAEYIGNNLVKQIPVTASAAGGSFRLFAAAAWRAGQVQPPADHGPSGTVQLPHGLRISPTDFSLQKGGTQTLTVAFSPAAVGALAASAGFGRSCASAPSLPGTFAFVAVLGPLHGLVMLDAEASICSYGT
jgi:hypothetical protein